MGGFEQTIDDDEKNDLLTMVRDIDNRIQYTETHVTSAEVLDLFDNHKVLVEAPGAGLVLEFVSAIFVLDYAGAAYATNGILSITETDLDGTALSVAVLLAPFLAQTADTILPVQALETGLALTEDTPMVLSIATAETITGTSPLNIRTFYRVHTTNL